MLGGHGGDAVTWLTEHARRLGNLVGVFARRARAGGQGVRRREPDRRPTSARPGTARCRRRRTPGPDDGVGEAPPPGWTRSFPHVLKGTADAAGRDASSRSGSAARSPTPTSGGSRRRWCSRCSSASTTAPTCSPSASRRPTWSATRSARAATRSRTSTRTWTRRIGTLFDALDAQVGKDRWVAGLSADHGVTPIPEQLVAEGKDAGRISGGALVDAVEQALRPALGAGAARRPCSTPTTSTSSRASTTRSCKSRELMDAGARGDRRRARASSACSAAKRCAARAKSKDPLLRAAALSYFPGTQRRPHLRDQAGLDDFCRRHDARLARTPTISACRCCSSGTASSRANTRSRRRPPISRRRWPRMSGLSMKAEGHALPCAAVEDDRRRLFAPRAVGRPAHSARTRGDLRRRRGARRPPARGARRRQHHARLRPARRAVPPRDCRRRTARRLRRQRSAEAIAARGRRASIVSGSRVRELDRVRWSPRQRAPEVLNIQACFLVSAYVTAPKQRPPIPFPSKERR